MKIRISIFDEMIAKLFFDKDYEWLRKVFK